MKDKYEQKDDSFYLDEDSYSKQQLLLKTLPISNRVLAVNNKISNILQQFLEIGIENMKSDNIIILASEMMIRFNKLQKIEYN